MNAPKHIALACCTDEKFTPYSAVMLESAIENTPDTDITIYYLHDPAFSEGAKTRLKDLLTKNRPRVHILFFEVPPQWVEGLPLFKHQKPGSMPPIMWYRIFLPAIATLESKIIYLDSDLLVLDDLNELWNWNVAGKPLAAVTNPFVQEKRHQQILDLPGKLGLPRSEDYFNSGVMLLNLDYFRTNNLSEKILDHGRKHADITMFGDQDSLCALLYRDRVHLPPRWNFMGTIMYTSSIGKKHFSDAEQAVAFSNPGIVHFEGPQKPWGDPSFHPYGRHYLRYAKKVSTPVPSPPWNLKDLENFLMRHQWWRLLKRYRQLRRVASRIARLNPLR